MSLPSPDQHTAISLSRRFGPRWRWLVLATLMIGTIASIMSSTIVNVAVPDLMQYFHIEQAQAQWVSAGFMAAMTLAMLPTPWLLGRFGFRLTYMGVSALLLIGGVVGGLAGSFELVLAMRVVEGIAAGVMQPIPSIMVMRAFEPTERGKAMGIFAFGVVLAPAVGPTIGGLLVEQFGWRSIFFVVVPFCVVALGLAQRYLPDLGSQASADDEDPPRVPFDFRGLALATVSVLCLLQGLSHLHKAFDLVTLALLAVAVGVMGWFVHHCRHAEHPLVDLRIFRARAFAMGAVVAFVYGMGLFGSTYLVPVFMQTALHFTPSAAGAALLPAGLVLAVVIPVAGRLADRIPPHHLVCAGLVFLAASFALMGTVQPGTALAVLMLWAAIGRLGLGLVLPSLSLGSLKGLDGALIPQAVSNINFLRQLGGAIGISVVSIFLEWRLRSVHPTDNSSVAAFSQTYWLVAAICATAVIAAARMRPRPGPAQQAR